MPPRSGSTAGDDAAGRAGGVEIACGDPWLAVWFGLEWSLHGSPLAGFCVGVATRAVSSEHEPQVPAIEGVVVGGRLCWREMEARFPERWKSYRRGSGGIFRWRGSAILGVHRVRRHQAVIVGLTFCSIMRRSAMRRCQRFGGDCRRVFSIAERVKCSRRRAREGLSSGPPAHVFWRARGAEFSGSGLGQGASQSTESRPHVGRADSAVRDGHARDYR